MKIRVRLVIASFIPVLLTLLVILAVVYSQTFSSSLESAKETALSLTYKNGHKSQLIFERAAKIAGTLGDLFKDKDSYFEGNQTRLIADVIKSALQNNDEMFGVWAVFEPDFLQGDPDYDFEFYDSQNHFSVWWLRRGEGYTRNSRSNSDGDPGLRYSLPRDKKSVVMLNPTVYLNAAGEPSLQASVAWPIFDGTRFIGVVGVDFSLGSLQELAASVREFKSDFSFLVAENGILVAHPDKEAQGKAFAEAFPDLEKQLGLGDKLAKGEPILHVGDKDLVVLAPFSLQGSSNTWYFGMSVPLDEILAASRILLLLIVVSVAAGLVLLAISAVISSGIVLKPLSLLSDTLHTLSTGTGDLSIRMEESRKDEIGDMGRSFNLFSQTMSRMIQEIRESTEDLHESGTRLKNSVNIATEGVGGILHNVQKTQNQVEQQGQSYARVEQSVSSWIEALEGLKGALQSQFAAVNQSSASIEEMVSNIKSVESSTDRIGQTMKSLVDAAQNGRSAVDHLGERIREISGDSQTLLDANQVIATIAAQTNLLAMNAAIESAHAGDAGRGFSVVADEIRKLAETATRQSKEIAQQLKQVKTRIDSTVQDNTRLIDSFRAIQGYIGQNDSLIHEVRVAMTEQSVGSNQILEALEDIHKVSAHVMDSTGRMDTESDVLGKELARLIAQGKEIRALIHDISERSGDIRTELDVVGQELEANYESIESVRRQVASFKL